VYEVGATVTIFIDLGAACKTYGTDREELRKYLGVVTDATYAEMCNSDPLTHTLPPQVPNGVMSSFRELYPVVRVVIPSAE
jgi:hypothetical protein